MTALLYKPLPLDADAQLEFVSAVSEQGRPSTYTDEIASAICRRLACGETLRAICRDEGMPAESTVRGWALDNQQGFSAQYVRAREIGYLSMADEIVEIADETRFDTIRGDEDAADRPNTEWISRSRLRVDTRKWLLSKALPKVFGDKIDVNNKLVDENGEGVPLSEAVRRMAFLLAQASEAQAAPAAPPTKH